MLHWMWQSMKGLSPGTKVSYLNTLPLMLRRSELSGLGQGMGAVCSQCRCGESMSQSACCNCDPELEGVAERSSGVYMLLTTMRSPWCLTCRVPSRTGQAALDASCLVKPLISSKGKQTCRVRLQGWTIAVPLLRRMQADL